MDIKEIRTSLVTLNNSIVDKAKNENRELSQEELEQVDKLKAQIADLDAQLQELESKREDENKENEEETPVEETPQNQDEVTSEPESTEVPSEPEPSPEETPSEEEDEETNKENRNHMNFIETLKSATQEKRAVTMKMFETRDVLNVGGNAGQNVVATDIIEILPALRANSLLGEMKVINTTNDAQIAVYSGAQAGFIGEGEDFADGAGEFTKKVLAPKTLGAQIVISSKLLANTTPEVENMIKTDLLNAITTALMKAIFSSAEGDTDTPKGVLNGAEEVSLDWNAIVAIEKALEEANVGEGTYVVAPGVKAHLRTQSISGGKSDVRMIWDLNNEIGGVKAYSNSCVEDNGLVYGDLKNICVAIFGGSELILDPYTLAGKDQVRIVAKLHCDFAVARDNAIVAKKMV